MPSLQTKEPIIGCQRAYINYHLDNLISVKQFI